MTTGFMGDEAIPRAMMKNDKKIRILRLIARLNVGGPARHVIWLTSRLGDRHEIMLASGSVEANEREMTEFCREEGVTPVYVAGLGRSIGLGDVAAFFRVLRLIREFQPDVVDTHTAKAGLLGRAAVWVTNLGRRRDQRIRTVHTFHGHVLHGYFSPLVSRFFHFLERLLGRHATDAIVVISPQQFDELAHHYHIAPPEKFHMVPLGMDLDAIARRPDGAGGPQQAQIRVGLVGRLTAIKDPLMFLEAGRLVQVADPRVKLVVIGDGELRETMEHTATASGADVEFLGNRDDINLLMATLDVLAISSLNEGTPMSVLEAFAAGVPVAGTRVGGVIDLLNGGRGLLSEMKDAAGLASNILRLIREPDLAASVRACASTYVHLNYKLGRLLEDMSAIYDESSTTSPDADSTPPESRGHLA